MGRIAANIKHLEQISPVSQDGFVIGQFAGAIAEAKQRFQAEVAADRLILDDIGADRRGRPVAAAVFGRWLTPSLA